MLINSRQTAPINIAKQKNRTLVSGFCFHDGGQLMIPFLLFFSGCQVIFFQKMEHFIQGLLRGAPVQKAFHIHRRFLREVLLLVIQLLQDVLQTVVYTAALLLHLLFPFKRIACRDKSANHPAAKDKRFCSEAHKGSTDIHDFP